MLATKFRNRAERAEGARGGGHGKGVRRWKTQCGVLQAGVCDLGEEEVIASTAVLAEVQDVVVAGANQVLQDVLNQSRAMPAMASSSNNNQVRPPPQQQFLTNDGAALGLWVLFINACPVGNRIQWAIPIFIMAWIR